MYADMYAIFIANCWYFALLKKIDQRNNVNVFKKRQNLNLKEKFQKISLSINKIPNSLIFFFEKEIPWKFQVFPDSNILFLLCSRQDDDYFIVVRTTVNNIDVQLWEINVFIECYII